MKAIENQNDRSLRVFVSGFVRGIFSHILMLFGKGLSLGFVLFLALSTLSLLNRGMDSLSSSSKSSKAGLSQRQNFQIAVPVSRLPYRVASQPDAGGAYTRSNQTQNARDTIRESGYFVSSVESFMRSLGRFAK